MKEQSKMPLNANWYYHKHYDILQLGTTDIYSMLTHNIISY